jgi:hypothetical protein
MSAEKRTHVVSEIARIASITDRISIRSVCKTIQFKIYIAYPIDRREYNELFDLEQMPDHHRPLI